MKRERQRVRGREIRECEWKEREEGKRVQFGRTRVLASKKSLIRCSRQRNSSFSENRGVARGRVPETDKV